MRRYYHSCFSAPATCVSSPVATEVPPAIALQPESPKDEEAALGTAAEDARSVESLSPSDVATDGNVSDEPGGCPVWRWVICRHCGTTLYARAGEDVEHAGRGSLAGTLSEGPASPPSGPVFGAAHVLAGHGAHSDVPQRNLEYVGVGRSLDSRSEFSAFIDGPYPIPVKCFTA